MFSIEDGNYLMSGSQDKTINVKESFHDYMLSYGTHIKVCI